MSERFIVVDSWGLRGRRDDSELLYAYSPQACCRPAGMVIIIRSSVTIGIKIVFLSDSSVRTRVDGLWRHVLPYVTIWCWWCLGAQVITTGTFYTVRAIRIGNKAAVTVLCLHTCIQSLWIDDVSKPRKCHVMAPDPCRISDRST